MRTTITMLCALTLVAVAAPVSAQDYPTKPISLVVAQPPGASSDLLGRTLAERLQVLWGQTVVVENKPGAGGNIGATLVARAAPDGYTLMIGTDAMMTANVYLYKNIGYDPAKDFAPVAIGGFNSICLCVNAALPVKNVAELIAYAKTNPGKLQFGTPGAASPHHLSGELIMQKTGIKIVHVPYRGGGPATNDLIGGHIGMAFLSLSSAVPALATGKIRILALVDKQRYAAMPDVPTVGETVPGFAMDSWLGVFAPAKTPEPIVAKLNQTINKIYGDAPVKARLATLGLTVQPMTPPDLATLIQDGLKVRGDLIKASGIQPQ